MVGGVPDVITCAKFQIEIFMGYDFTGGRIFDFCIDFSMGLTTVQRYCAACDCSDVPGQVESLLGTEVGLSQCYVVLEGVRNPTNREMLGQKYMSMVDNTNLLWPENLFLRKLQNTKFVCPIMWTYDNFVQLTPALSDYF